MGVGFINDIRSRHLAHSNEIGSKHEASIFRKMGDLDPSIGDANMELTPAVAVAAARATTGNSRGLVSLQITSLLGRPVDWVRARLIDATLHMLSGTFVFSDKPIRRAGQGGVEGLILAASNETLEAARLFSKHAPFVAMASFMFGTGGQNAIASAQLEKKVKRTFRNRPRYTALVLGDYNSREIKIPRPP